MKANDQVRPAARGSRVPALILLLAVALLAASCVIENPVLESAEGAETDAAPTSIPQLEPTALPSPPTPQPIVPETPTPEPDPTPEPTPLPAPTSEPVSEAPPPLPTATDEADFQPTTVPAGLVAIPVLDTTFRLDDPRPILQLGGHTLIYLDENGTSEVDIFTPVAFDDGTMITSYNEVITFLQSDPRVELAEGQAVTIGSHNTRVFEGLGLDRTRAFITDTTQLGNELLGWWPPDKVKLWVVDHPRGTVIVTAEAFDASDRYTEAVDLAADILSTIDFG